MPVNEKEFTKEMVTKAMQCETTEDLIAFAKSNVIKLRYFRGKNFPLADF